MKKLSARPSPAMIVACVALFVGLGGTATAVTYVVSSNSQVGPGTISGHKPPTGKHANIIGGSVNGTDLASGAVTNAKLGANAVTGGKVLNDSLGGGDVNEATLNGSQITGVDAATLGGQTAGAFAPASEVKKADLIALNDPIAGDSTPATQTMFTFETGGTVHAAVTATCLDDSASGNLDIAQVTVDSFPSTGGSFSALRSDGSSDSNTGNGSGNAVDLESPGPGNTDGVQSGYFVLNGADGKVRTGSVSAELNDADTGSDCTFSGTTLGF